MYIGIDIGGTKTLLGIYQFTGTLKLIHRKYYISKDWPFFENLVASSFVILLINFISAPATKAFSPEPVIPARIVSIIWAHPNTY